MERLTYDCCVGNDHSWQVRGADNDLCEAVCGAQENGCKECPIGKAFDRLAAIEDILGDEYDLANLRDILQAEQDGRLVVLPCALETDIFRVGKNTIFGDWQVAYAEVYPDAIIMIDDSDNHFESDDIGKTVFLTREEAEAALAGKGGYE